MLFRFLVTVSRSGSKRSRPFAYPTLVNGCCDRGSNGRRDSIGFQTPYLLLDRANCELLWIFDVESTAIRSDELPSACTGPFVTRGL